MSYFVKTIVRFFDYLQMWHPLYACVSEIIQDNDNLTCPIALWSSYCITISTQSLKHESYASPRQFMTNLCGTEAVHKNVENIQLEWLSSCTISFWEKDEFPLISSTQLRPLIKTNTLSISSWPSLLSMLRFFNKFYNVYICCLLIFHYAMMRGEPIMWLQWSNIIISHQSHIHHNIMTQPWMQQSPNSQAHDSKIWLAKMASMN
mgnify:FL=1